MPMEARLFVRVLILPEVFLMFTRCQHYGYFWLSGSSIFFLFVFISEFDITEIKINPASFNINMSSDYIAEIDAQITTSEELEDQLNALDKIDTEEARRLQAVLNVIWVWRQRRAKGRKIRRVADLKADIRMKTEQMHADSKKLREETSEYINEYSGANEKKR